MIFKKSHKTFVFSNHRFLRSKGWSDNIQGIFWMVSSCFLGSVMVAVVRHLSSDLHIFHIVMMRNFFALLFFMPYIIKSRAGIFYTKKLHLHIARGLVGLAAMFTWFYAIILIPLPEVVSITFIAPIVTTIAAMIFLKERVNKNSWIALLVGFIGILIIIRPGFKEFKLAYLLPLLTAFAWATTAIFVKIMTDTEKPATIVVYMAFIIFFASIPFAIPYLKAMSLDDLFWLAVLGVISNLSHISLSNAFSRADLSIVQPFDFTRLIFISIIAYFAFGEVIDFWTIIGSLVILFGSIYFRPKPQTGIVAKIKKLFGKKPLPPQLGIEM